MKKRGRKRILCIDDDADSLLSLKAYLEENGYRAIVCKDARQSIGIVQEKSVDLVVMAYRVSRVKDIMCAMKMKVVRPRLPIILMVDYPGEVPNDVSIFDIQLPRDGPRAQLDGAILKILRS